MITNNFIKMPANRIQSVTEHGIEWLDDNGAVQFINFEACYQCWLQDSLANLDKYFPSFANEEAFRNHFEDWKEVGARYSPVYIQFYSEPQVRFTFDDETELWRIVKQIRRTGGWTTIDLT